LERLLESLNGEKETDKAIHVSAVDDEFDDEDEFDDDEDDDDSDEFDDEDEELEQNQV
jgi:hypothetical protein